mmetsp:Transcript_33949/g.25032  ORF Transcript_33949/g.25032 Transcript_33949/m.25032 type:complete len:87 (+) Transcript_33949:437-697(+)
MLDGRKPTSSDFDFASENLGPDDVIVSPTLSSYFFDQTNYNASKGMLFMVGVKALTDKVEYSLFLTGPKHYQLNFTDLTAGIPIVS